MLSSHAHFFRRESAHTLFTPLAYDSQTKLFVNSDATIGFGFVCTPMTGADEGTAAKLGVLLNQNFPSNTCLQSILWASPDIEGTLFEAMRARQLNIGEDDVAKLLRESTRQSVDFLRDRTTKPVESVYGTRVRDMLQIITVKVPLKGAEPTEAEMAALSDLRNSTVQALRTIGMQSFEMTAAILTRLMHSMLHWGDGARWQSETDLYDKEVTLSGQFLDYDHSIEFKPREIVLGKEGDPNHQSHVVCLSPKRYPSKASVSGVGAYIGDFMTGSRGIRTNFMLVWNIFYPDAQNLKAGLETRKNWTIHSSQGPIARFSPRLHRQKESFEVLFEKLDGGDRPVRAAMHLVLFNQTNDEAVSNASAARTYYRELGFQMMDDVYLQRAVFINSMPFGMDAEAVEELKRFKSYATTHVAQMLPVVADWKGTRTATLPLISRNGQLMKFCLFDSDSSMNAVCCAQSGSGKSFLANALITAYLESGNAKVYVIDVGRSYEKLCNSFHGQFLEFGSDNRASFNPFPLVNNYNEEADMLIGILSAMAAPTDRLSDFQRAELRRVLKEIWDVKEKTTTVDDIYAALVNEPEEPIRWMGKSLYPFTSKGEYGSYFQGENTLRFGTNFTCLELGELKGRKHLQKVVLLSLIYQINNDLFLGDRSVRKFILIDEAWQLLAEGDVADFMVAGYRQARKHNGAFMICTQSIFDLYSTPNGQAIIENSPNMLVLGQKSETINMLRESKKLDMSDAGFDWLKTVRSQRGHFSEIFIKTDSGSGIGRLVVDRFRQLLFSTFAPEVTAIDKRMDQGMTITEAINDLIASERRESLREAA